MPANFQMLYSPEPAYIDKIHVHRGDQVSQGQPLIEFASLDLQKGYLGARATKEAIEKQLLYVKTVEGQ